MASVNMICLVLALVCFLMAALNVVAPRVSLGWLGLFFFALAGLIK